jgi:8-oxo-dGTP pyrophosphatase MutT (NUDIX family)
MMEPAFRVKACSSPWLKQSTMPFYKTEMVFNKAFSSLSFRGKRGYPTNILNKQHTTQQKEKALTYGAILKIVDKTGEPLYALVQGRYTGKWSFPKGHANEGEAPIECTLREVGEETGIDNLPEPDEYLHIGYGNYFVFNLSVEIPLIPRDTHEIMDTKWMSLEEMKDTPLNADASQFLKMMSKQ